MVERMAWELISICFDALMSSPRNSLPSKSLVMSYFPPSHCCETVLQDVDVLVDASRASQIINLFRANHNAGKQSYVYQCEDSLRQCLNCCNTSNCTGSRSFHVRISACAHMCLRMCGCTCACPGLLVHFLLS